MALGPGNIKGYGRYKDDPEHVGCPRARSDMTPCIARDAALALADDLRCVGCNADPHILLAELLSEAGAAAEAADVLTETVRALTEPEPA